MRISHSGRRPGIRISVRLHTSGFLVKPGMSAPGKAFNQHGESPCHGKPQPCSRR